MLTLECPYCHIPADKTELTPGYQAHLKRFGPDSTDEDFESHMFARKKPNQAHRNRSFIGGSFSSGVAR